jgi:hypothetical protein
VVIPALIWGGWRVRLVLVGLFGFCLALLVALDLYFAPRNGWFAHGRYALPTAVGSVALAALSERGPTRWVSAVRSRWLSVALVTATAPVHGYALARVMTRYQSGIDAPLNPFAGQWLPPGGPLLPLTTLALGLAALVVLTTITESDVPVAAVMVSEGLDNGSVKPNGRRAERAAKSSTTDAATH